MFAGGMLFLYVENQGFMFHVFPNNFACSVIISRAAVNRKCDHGRREVCNSAAIPLQWRVPCRIKQAREVNAGAGITPSTMASNYSTCPKVWQGY